MKISQNKHINALILLILFSAISHLVLLFIYFLKSYDISMLNYFNILDLDLFFPGIEQGIFSHILSLLFMIFVYIIAYRYFS